MVYRSPDDHPAIHGYSVERDQFAAEAAADIANLPVVETVVEPPQDPPTSETA